MEGPHSLIHISHSENIEQFKFLIQDLSAVGDDGTSQSAAKVKVSSNSKAVGCVHNDILALPVTTLQSYFGIDLTLVIFLT